MKNLKNSGLIILMFIVSITMSGCNFSDFPLIVDKVANVIKTLGQSIQENFGGGSSGTATTTQTEPTSSPEDVSGQSSEPVVIDTGTGTGSATATSTGTQVCQIVIYSTSWCPNCKDAKAYFNSKGTPFIEKDIEKDPAAKSEMEQKARAQGIDPSGVPVIDVCGTMVVGFDANRIEQILAEKSGQGATEQSNPGM